MLEPYKEMLRDTLVGLPRPAKKLISVAADFSGFLVCASLTHWLHLGSTMLLAPNIVAANFVIAVIGTVLAAQEGLYRSVVRYMGADVFTAGARTSTLTALLGAALFYFVEPVVAPVHWGIIFACTSFIYICSSRWSARHLLVKRKAKLMRERVVIYGAGEAGSQLAIGLLGGDEFLPVAVIDDDPTLVGTRVRGLPVLSPKKLGNIIKDTGAKKVLLAIPSASYRHRRYVLETLSSFPVHVQTMPNLRDLVSGKARVDDLSDVDVKDLLGRDPVPPDPGLLALSVSGKNVLVTGAGGSIGAELCRQIIRLAPKRLVLFEVTEYSLYAIQKELSAIVTDLDQPTEIVPLLGSVLNRSRLAEVLSVFEIDTVYHAAAYKHVPLVEHNIIEGVRNNVFGTYFLAHEAAKARVEKFVLISTDKAVSPTNVMGATKRLAELILQAIQDDYRDTCFCMVRFGNVLESSGSVVPLFKEQIRCGGPVTVTHRDITRYFMTIPEAAELVIQAAAMAKGGDVFVLDMGEPVRILDLATRMIQLMGLTVRDDKNKDGDISIQFTGLRPAEKLYEELLIGSDVTGTKHPRIMRANEEKIPSSALEVLMAELLESTDGLDRHATRNVLLRAVAGYGPTNDIADLIWTRENGRKQAEKASTIVDFPPRRS